MVAGRPREFDYDKALEKAMRVFWTKGYEGTSMPDLTKAMGMNRPSIYAAFGNKEELFKKSLERYSENTLNFLKTVSDAPTVREAVQIFLLGSADTLACKEKPRGCFAVQSALIGSDQSKTLCKETLKKRESTVFVLQERFKQGIKDGELPHDTDVTELARFFTTVLQGMSIQSVSGASCTELKAIANRALIVLPVK